MAAGNSVIGALRVELGLDSAQYEAGLRSAQRGLDKFGVQLTLGLETIANAVGQVIGALPAAIKGAIDGFDEMSKAAQKVGTTTQALSQLNYAAQLSDVSLEQLTGGLQKLSRSMADVVGGSKGPAATAFAALGVSITDAAGKMRSSTDVFADVADKFARMEDGSTKTALAMGLFGRAGAEMIPLLNSGRDGLKEMADEADRLGITINQVTAREAEQFNDNLTRVNAGITGIVNQITSAALPVFTYLSEKFIEAAGNGAQLERFAKGFTETLKFLITVGAITVTALQTIGEAFATLMTAGTMAQTGFQNWGVAADILKNGFTNLGNEIGATTEFINGLWSAVDTGGGDGESTPLTPFVADMGALAASTNAAKAATDALKQAQQDAMAVFDATRTPFEQMQIDLQRLDELLGQGLISWETYGRAAGDAMAGAASATLGSLTGLSAGLSQAFEDNKVLAIATAVLKGAEAVASAFAAGNAIGGPIVGAAFAATAAITAAANVAAVASTTKTSKSMNTPSAAVPTPAAQSGSGTAVNVTLQGQSFGRDQIRELLENIAEYSRDGSMIRVHV